MRIAVTSIFVDDQTRAVQFYTELLGFQKKYVAPVGKDLWPTVVSQLDPDGIELLLEPAEHPAVRTFRAALADDGIPSLQISTSSTESEYHRLKAKGVNFTQRPTRMGDFITAVFDDSCGNLIQLISPAAAADV